MIRALKLVILSFPFVALAACRTVPKEDHTKSKSYIDATGKEISSIEREQVVFAYRAALTTASNIIMVATFPHYFGSEQDYVFLIIDGNSGNDDRVACFVDERVNDNDGNTPINIEKCQRWNMQPERIEDLKTKGYDCKEDPYLKKIACSKISSNFKDLLIGDASICKSDKLEKPDTLDCTLVKLAINPALVIDKNKDKNCTCGTDISEQLGAIKQEVVSYFNELSYTQKTTLCPSMQSATGWDIRALYKTEGFNSFEHQECGRANSLCSSTVTVNGACYFAGEVNYFLYGLISHLCNNKLNDILSKIRFSKEAMVASINIWRGMKANEGHPYNAEERVAWALIGWDAIDLEGNVSYPADLKAYSVAVKEFAACSYKYEEDRLDWHLGEE